jgi:hypothetical protein
MPRDGRPRPIPGGHGRRSELINTRVRLASERQNYKASMRQRRRELKQQAKESHRKIPSAREAPSEKDEQTPEQEAHGLAIGTAAAIQQQVHKAISILAALEELVGGVSNAKHMLDHVDFADERLATSEVVHVAMTAAKVRLQKLQHDWARAEVAMLDAEMVMMQVQHKAMASGVRKRVQAMRRELGQPPSALECAADTSYQRLKKLEDDSTRKLTQVRRLRSRAMHKEIAWVSQYWQQLALTGTVSDGTKASARQEAEFAGLQLFERGSPIRSHGHAHMSTSRLSPAPLSGRSGSSYGVT